MLLQPEMYLEARFYWQPTCLLSRFYSKVGGRVSKRPFEKPCVRGNCLMRWYQQEIGQGILCHRWWHNSPSQLRSSSNFHNPRMVSDSNAGAEGYLVERPCSRKHTYSFHEESPRKKRRIFSSSSANVQDEVNTNSMDLVPSESMDLDLSTNMDTSRSISTDLVSSKGVLSLGNQRWRNICRLLHRQPFK